MPTDIITTTGDGQWTVVEQGRMTDDGQYAPNPAAGATDDEAKQAAQTAACAMLAFDMAQSIQCDRTVPKTESCTSS